MASLKSTITTSLVSAYSEQGSKIAAKSAPQMCFDTGALESTLPLTMLVVLISSMSEVPGFNQKGPNTTGI